ncbi:hypothetical protein L7F22_069200 [Adiantum nelumboides]|nr:hypothetical protein [Adiantum nelumboides]
MNPPASARSKPKCQKEIQETAFREITARANAFSKSAQDPFTVIKKMEVEQTGKGGTKTPNASRRYSVASKFAGPKADNSSFPSSASQSKPRLNKRASLQGVMNEPQFHGTSTQSRPILSNSTAVPSAKPSAKATMVSSFQGNISGSLHRRQSAAFGQPNKPHKACTDSFKRSAPGCGKADSTQAHTDKTRGMLLRSASYWMEQVKLAETLGKYGVSIGFFRLAVECGAEPIELLKEELIAFIERNALWSDTIQQVLLCYGVATTDRQALLSRRANSCTKQSSPCAPDITNSSYSADKELAHQVCQELTKNLDQDFDIAAGKDSVEGTTKEEAQILDEHPVLGATGHIKNMDAASITREVVSCILFSMNHNGGCSNDNIDVYPQPKTYLMVKGSEEKTHFSSATDVSTNCAESTVESISDLDSAIQEEARSSESLPSLNVWNMPEATVTCIPASQEEVSLTRGNDSNDSTSTSRVSGEEMCVSMELVDTLSDDLQSGNLASDESKFHATQTTQEIQRELLKGPDSKRNSNDEMHVALPQAPVCKNSQNKTPAKLQKSERGRNISGGDYKTKDASCKTNVELPTLQVPCKLESQGNRRMGHCLNGKIPNMKEKLALMSDTTTENSASRTDKPAGSDTPSSWRLSLSTPRSTFSAHRQNSDTISRTRRKGGLSQLAEQGNQSHHQVQVTNAIAEMKGIVATPNQDRKVEDGVVSEQVSVHAEDGLGMQTTNDTDLTATPGSVGVRRSARLLKPSGVSTPTSVSTPHLQRRIETPKRA